MNRKIPHPIPVLLAKIEKENLNTEYLATDGLYSLQRFVGNGNREAAKSFLDFSCTLNEKPFDSQLYWQSHKLFHVTPGTIFSDYEF